MKNLSNNVMLSEKVSHVIVSTLKIFFRRQSLKFGAFKFHRNKVAHGIENVHKVMKTQNSRCSKF